VIIDAGVADASLPVVDAAPLAEPLLPMPGWRKGQLHLHSTRSAATTSS
jgi:hypothetical protein